jgi:hypothetical protein
MLRVLRSRKSGLAVGALAVVALHGSAAFAWYDDSETTSAGPPAQEQQAPANAPPAAIVRFPGAQRGIPDFKAVLEDQRQSYRALLISELRFCRSAGGLTKEQCERIALEAGVIVEQAAYEAARLNLKPAENGGNSLGPKPVKAVRFILEKLVGALATPEQHRRYVAEGKKRDAHRKETAIHALVARLDRTLTLSSSQREQLLRVFDSNWDEEWGVLNGVMGDDEAPLPAIPERLIMPLLSVSQRMTWKRFQIEAIDATEAYISAVAEVMEGLPSEFAPSLEAAVRQAEKLRTATEKEAKPK